MITVRVERTHPDTGVKSEIGRMLIREAGAVKAIANYTVEAHTNGLAPRTGKITRHRRYALPVWNLVLKAVVAAGYTE